MKKAIIKQLLASPPPLEITLESEKIFGEGGFLRLHRSQFRHTHPSQHGSTEQISSYSYDIVRRKNMHATVMLLNLVSDGQSYICLRRSLRPALWREKLGTPAIASALPATPAWLWELPAGLLEEQEVGWEGIQRCASRETQEEVGLHIEPRSFERLGTALYSSPGIIAETLHFVTATVVLQEPLTTPQGDGSPVEALTQLLLLPLTQAEEVLQSGVITDMKTEVGIRRFIRQ